MAASGLDVPPGGTRSRPAPPPLTAAVGLSGGVDSAVAACLLKRQGFDVIGLTMQLWDDAEPGPAPTRGCYGPHQLRELEGIRRLADRLGIRHAAIPLAGEFRRLVLEPVRCEYLAGRTPNPCVRCNRDLKFGLLIEKARAAGLAFDRFATGHYAQVGYDPPRRRYTLSRGRDLQKDQSYFLYALTQARLAGLLLPLGGAAKQEVRALAREWGLADLADRPESQDFAGSDYRFLFPPGAARPGPIVDRAGRVLGEHRGLAHYTIGQRQGLGLGGSAEPWYVLALDAATHTLTVGRRADLYADRLLADDISWIAGEPPTAPIRVQARIRYRHQPADAAVALLDNAERRAAVVFDQPQMAIAPGQAVVFYQGNLVLGGGIIAPSDRGPAA